MNDQDQTRFVSNIGWFNQFFAGIRQLYGIVIETLPSDFFAEGFQLASGNYYFPRQNFAPTIPPYYVLMVGGREHALQVVAVFDSDLFANQGLFAAEPSIVVAVHSQAQRYAFIDDHVMRVIRNRGIEIAHHVDDKVWGTMEAKFPANFFSFQVSFDKFSVDQNPRDAVREHIVGPIIENLSLIPLE